MRLLCLVFIFVPLFSFGEDIIDSCYSKHCDLSDSRFSLYKALGTNCTENKLRINFWYHQTKNQAYQLSRDFTYFISRINPRKPLKLLIHGLGSDGYSKYDYMQQIQDAYFDANGTSFTILVIDYGSEVPATPLYAYPDDHCNLLEVGFVIADFLYLLNTTYRLQVENMHLIGFSFGAHLAGMAGYLLQKNGTGILGRITGLDPLGAGYLCVTCDWLKLDKNDASFVDVIHTNPGRIGISESVGDEDFFVNWPHIYQPGCREYTHPGCFWLNASGCVQTESKRECFHCRHSTCNDSRTADECSSSRSCALFAESILCNDFLATSCYSMVHLSECFPVDHTYMGEYAVPARYHNYYVKTRAEPPFGYGDDTGIFNIFGSTNMSCNVTENNFYTYFD